MNLHTDLPLDAGPDGLFHAVVEIPKHATVKYEYSEQYSCVMVDRMFKTPVQYPQNYGFFPQTWNKYDNDPMDVIIITKHRIEPGVAVPVRIVGMIEMDDTGELDHKILAVPAGDPMHIAARDLSDIHPELIANLEWFLGHYKDREDGKFVKILGTKNAQDALTFLEECRQEYLTHHAPA